jgi:vitamin B12 transporter
VGSSADALDPAELSRRQIRSVVEALQLLNGGTSFASGGRGAVNSFFLRGAASTQTLILVDGIRINDANLSPGSLLGGAVLLGIGRLELVRGPQSPLYGGAAIGGVLALDAAPGRGRPRGSVELEGGSFGTWLVSGALDGASRDTRAALSLTVNGTENVRHPNQWNQRTQLIRLDQRISKVFSVGATLRGLQQEYQSPGDLRSTNTTPAGTTTFSHSLVTVWLTAAMGGFWRSRLLVGAQEHFTRGTDRYNGGPESSYSISGSRRVVEWQNTVVVAAFATLVAGVNREWSTVTGSGSATDERLWALYADAQVTPIPSLTLTAGARSDDYTTFDAAQTWRVTGAWRVGATETKLRGSIGTGFAPPSLAARFGGVYQNANPLIRPERARGWDLGMDQVVLGGRGTMSATWFRNTLTDLIGFESAPYPSLGRNVNIDRARATGLEFSSRIAAGPLDARLVWTALSAVSLSEPEPALARLIRRPRHTFNGDVVARLSTRGTLGGGVLLVTNREDTDFNVFPSVRVDPGNYLVARLYGSYDLSRRFTLRARVENLFNRRYEPVYGFPALPRSLSATAAVRL